MLQWWSPAHGKNQNEHVEGDLLSAILRSREIDQTLAQPPRSTVSHKSLTHQELVKRYTEDLKGRVEAGELAVGTCARYASALSHYIAFVSCPVAATHSANSSTVDREFALSFAAFLSKRLIAPNGHPNARPRPLAGTDFIIDTVRAMYQWASDPTRGRVLPEDFTNPFLRSRLKRRRPSHDLLREPDITLAMAERFLEACDGYAIRVMAPLIFYGLRPSETIFLFHEHIDDRWVGVPCIEDLGYFTKGVRDKKLPCIELLVGMWTDSDDEQGLVLVRRSVAEGREDSPLRGRSMDALITEYRRRCRGLTEPRRHNLERCRDSVIADAGGLTYGHLQREFRRVAKRLGWPHEATLKDFRHLFNTSLANGGMPEHERRYLMGHAPGRDAIVAYTHLNRLHDHFLGAIQAEMSPLLAVITRRLERSTRNDGQVGAA